MNRQRYRAVKPVAWRRDRNAGQSSLKHASCSQKNSRITLSSKTSLKCLSIQPVPTLSRIRQCSDMSTGLRRSMQTHVHKTRHERWKFCHHLETSNCHCINSLNLKPPVIDSTEISSFPLIKIMARFTPFGFMVPADTAGCKYGQI